MSGHPCPMEKKLEMAVVNSDCAYKNEKMERTGRSIENRHHAFCYMCVHICMCRCAYV